LYFLFQLQKLNDWNGIRFEVDVTTNAVHALGALLFEMEVIRSYLEPHELPYFDATLAPAQNSSVKALNRLQGKTMCYYFFVEITLQSF
jgi:hypothetical protein